MKTSEINLVDLAGSEGIDKTKSDSRQREGNNIHRSLHALSNVILKLGQKGMKFISYRDSKLTRILRKSLEGDSQTAIMLTINQSQKNTSQSMQTLFFGQNASHIPLMTKMNLQPGIDSNNELRKRLVETNIELDRLRKDCQSKKEIIEDMKRYKEELDGLGELKSQLVIFEEEVDSKNKEICQIKIEHEMNI